MPTTKYDEQAAAFVAATGLKIEKKYQGHRAYFESEPDKPQRAVWEITLSREGRGVPCTFTYGDSIQDSYAVQDLREGRITPRTLKHWPPMIYNAKGYRECLAAGGGEIQGIYRLTKQHPTPSDYDILTCLEKGGPTSFEDFCAEYGYDTDSRKALATFLEVQKQAQAIARMFTPAELEQLAEIN